MITTNPIYESVVAHLRADPANRVANQSRVSMMVLSAADLPKIKPDGAGLRIGKTYIFGCHVRFGRVTSQVAEAS